LTLTLVRGGDERDQVHLGTIEIANVEGDEDIGDYACAMRGAVHRDAKAADHERNRGPWRLALAALEKVLE
jgi:hypothetical protein